MYFGCIEIDETATLFPLDERAVASPPTESKESKLIGGSIISFVMLGLGMFIIVLDVPSLIQ